MMIMDIGQHRPDPRDFDARPPRAAAARGRPPVVHRARNRQRGAAVGAPLRHAGWKARFNADEVPNAGAAHRGALPDALQGPAAGLVGAGAGGAGAGAPWTAPIPRNLIGQLEDAAGRRARRQQARGVHAGRAAAPAAPGATPRPPDSLCRQALPVLIVFGRREPVRPQAAPPRPCRLWTRADAPRRTPWPGAGNPAACRPAWCRCWRGPAAPAPRAGRRWTAARGWRKNGAACADAPAWPARPQAALLQAHPDGLRRQARAARR
jgi:hypothetical protein